MVGIANIIIASYAPKAKSHFTIPIHLYQKWVNLEGSANRVQVLYQDVHSANKMIQLNVSAIIIVHLNDFLSS